MNDEEFVDEQVFCIVKTFGTKGITLGYLHALGSEKASCEIDDVARSINRLCESKKVAIVSDSHGVRVRLISTTK